MTTLRTHDATRGGALSVAEVPDASTELLKSPTGISGLDEVTEGGLPQGRSTLVCGPAGCGKTLLGMEFLVRGATLYDEPGVFLAFEESPADLIANVASLGFDLAELEADGLLVIDHVRFEAAGVEENGEWDLDGLMLRLGASIDSIGAKRVVVDTVETLFGAFTNAAVVRSELRRLFDWLKDRGVTAIITGERGEGTLTRHGIEEYVSDCVIVLDHRVTEQTSIRRLRILKYRGSHHGTNEYPFLIGRTGLSVLPITPGAAHHEVSNQRVSTGVVRLDAMLDGGFFKGSTVLISGTAGTGKSSLTAQFCDVACRSGGRALYFAFEGSEAEIIRNMSSIGLDLQQWVDRGLLQFRCSHPNLLGLEENLFDLQQAVTDFRPDVVIIDPISNLLRIGTATEVSSMLTRQVDFLQGRGITAMFTSVDSDAGSRAADEQITSLVDSWLLVQATRGNGEMNRELSVLKSRGMAHSNQVREFRLTSQGIELADVYVGPQGVLTGSARQAQEAKEFADGVARAQELEQRRANLERRRESVEAQTATLWREFEDEAEVVRRLLSHGSTGVVDRADQRAAQGLLRQADTDTGGAGTVESPEVGAA